MNESRRVVVTGLGVISPLGNTVATLWDALLAGKSGIRPITHFDASQCASQIAGTIPHFDSEEYGISSKDARKMDLFIQYGIAAAVRAVEDAGLEQLSDAQKERTGVIIGSGIGGLATIEKNADALANGGFRKISPFFIPGSIVNLCSGHVAIRYGLKGPNLAIATACTTGVHSIGLAARTIAYGDADIMVAGGTECASTPLGIGGFAAMRALSVRNDAPEKASRPFDRDRDGFVLSDGAAVLVLESLESAKKRGATIYAEIAGFGMSADAYHMTAPTSEGPAQAMKHALADARLVPADIQYVNAHGTSTPVGDGNETTAMKLALGDHAYQVAVSSTKSMTGHLLGAAGSIETLISILSVKNNIAPPTINLENPSEDCDLDYVPNEAREMKIQACLCNSFGFGGTNGSLVIVKS
jgi:3-oxoacyl-[acyl-carrier-protein] synthase II